MPQTGFVLITDRGGHLHDALRLLEQMRVTPDALITTVGPDVEYLKRSDELSGAEIVSFPQAFTWFGKLRIWNPFKFVQQLLLALSNAVRLRPRTVISLGASNVIPFCYFAKFFGARIFHVENLAQVVGKSVTGKMLYPICTELFVQWEELLPLYGPKARYQGWVL
jgi:UDP-N-acetylglucosamine:LPS N-acetylglucosamine transferase